MNCSGVFEDRGRVGLTQERTQAPATAVWLVRPPDLTRERAGPSDSPAPPRLCIPGVSAEDGGDSGGTERLQGPRGRKGRGAHRRDFGAGGAGTPLAPRGSLGDSQAGSPGKRSRRRWVSGWNRPSGLNLPPIHCLLPPLPPSRTLRRSASGLPPPRATRAQPPSSGVDITASPCLCGCRLFPQGFLFLGVSHQKPNQMVPPTVSAVGERAPSQAPKEGKRGRARGTRFRSCPHPGPPARWQLQRSQETHALQARRAFSRQTLGRSSGALQVPQHPFHSHQPP